MEKLGKIGATLAADGGLKYQTTSCQKINIYVHLQNGAKPEESKQGLAVTIASSLLLWKKEKLWVAMGCSVPAGKVVRTFTPIAIKSSEVGNMIA